MRLKVTLRLAVRRKAHQSFGSSGVSRSFRGQYTSSDGYIYLKCVFATFRRFRFFDFRTKIVGELFCSPLIFFDKTDCSAKMLHWEVSIQCLFSTYLFGLTGSMWSLKTQKLRNVTRGGCGSEGVAPEANRFFSIWTHQKL